MPRAHKGPRLELYGPDNRFGARPKRGFGQYAYYIRWTENGKTRECTTGIAATGGPPDIAAAEDALRRFLEYQRDTAQSGSTLGPRRADQIALAEVLDIYGREHATTVAAPARIAYAIDALVPYWGGMTVSEVTATARRAYVEHRRRAFAAREDARIAGVTAVGKQPKPARILSTDTVRRELGVLDAAGRYCVAQGLLVSYPQEVWLPARGTPRERHLSRSDIAKLIRQARKSARSRLHLPLYILIAYYTGARRSAILQLQWQPNTQGGWVDLDRGVIDFLGGRSQTKKRRVAIPIPGRLLTFLRYARRRTRQYVVEFAGKPIADPKRALAAAGAKAGLGNVFSHLLKHSAITYLMKAGVPIWQVSGWTGTSSETIERVYGHHAPDYLSDVLKAFRRSR